MTRWVISSASDKRLVRLIDDKIDIIVYPDGDIITNYAGEPIEKLVVYKWVPATQEDIDKVIKTIQNQIIKLQRDILTISGAL